MIDYHFSSFLLLASCIDIHWNSDPLPKWSISLIRLQEEEYNFNLLLAHTPYQAPATVAWLVWLMLIPP